EHLGAQPAQLFMVITEAARLRGAAASTGYRVPARRHVLTRAAGAGIAVDDGKARDQREVHLAAGGRGQRDVRHPQPGQVPSGARLGWPMASARVAAWETERTGPKISSRPTAMLSDTRSRTVGPRKKPARLVSLRPSSSTTAPSAAPRSM